MKNEHQKRRKVIPSTDVASTALRKEEMEERL
jgi:hypothetical protein